jgi:F0F1-type ATP synthase membrane subunit b/b'
MMNSNSVTLAAIYFFVVVILGAWFILNLIMAVFMDRIDEVDKTIDLVEKDPVLAEQYLVSISNRNSSADKMINKLISKRLSSISE